jgi:hypothetical protein
VYNLRLAARSTRAGNRRRLLTFEQQWTVAASGRTLPKFVTEELHKYLDCGILARGFAHLYCDDCGEHHVVAFSCNARAVCPSCLGRRMNEGALNLVDHVLPDVPIRQFVLTLPFPLRFPLAFALLVSSSGRKKKRRSEQRRVIM